MPRIHEELKRNFKKGILKVLQDHGELTTKEIMLILKKGEYNLGRNWKNSLCISRVSAWLAEMKKEDTIDGEKKYFYTKMYGYYPIHWKIAYRS